MNLQHLPVEILVQIAEYTPPASLNAFIKTNSYVLNLLEHELYRHNVRYHHSNALLWACFHGRENTVRKLLNANADVNVNTQPIKDDISRYYTCAELYYECVGQITREVAGRAGTIDYAFPILYAALGGNASIVELLIENGADIYFVGKGERNPLIMAAYRGHVDVIEVLLKHGADIEMRDGRGATPLMRAAAKDRFAAVEFLIQCGANIHARDCIGRTALTYAAIAGQTGNSLRLLLDHGADIESYDSSAVTPLMEAVHGARVTSAKILLYERGANPNCVVGNGLTPLWWIVEKDPTREYLSVMADLLKNGADANVVCEGTKPLQRAAERGFRVSVELLLRYGADPNDQKDGVSLLSWAIQTQHDEIADLLREYGAHE